jgi:hypothetical protein
MASNLSNAPTRPSISATAYKPNPAHVSRLGLSGDSDTSPLDLTTAGVLVHTATDYAYDEVFLWASNYSVGNNELTLEIGGDGSFSDPSKTIVIELTAKGGLVQVYPGVPHKQVSIYAKADQNSKINLFGYVDRHYRISLTDESLGYSAGDA